MCVILYKPKGVELPTKQELKKCWDKNPDGAGFMFEQNGKVLISKGHMTFEKFLNALNTYNRKNVLMKKDVVLHFRIGTSGAMDGTATHPFPLTSNPLDLKSLFTLSDMGLAHNGVMQSLNKIDKEWSDTQLFVMKYLSPLKDGVDFFHNSAIHLFIKNYLGIGNKIILLNAQGDVIRFGNWKEKNGIYYSNLNHDFSNKYTSKTTKRKPYKVIDILDDEDIEYIKDSQVIVDSNGVEYMNDEYVLYAYDRNGLIFEYDKYTFEKSFVGYLSNVSTL